MSQHKDEIVNEYKQGMSIKDIAEKYKITRPTIYNYLKEKNIVPNRITKNDLLNDTEKIPNELKMKEYLDELEYSYIYNRASADDKNICGRYRPDFLFKGENYYVIVEVDEHEHSQYDPNCEVTRMLNITYGLGLHTIFLRFNPDCNYVDKKNKITINDDILSSRFNILGERLNEALSYTCSDLEKMPLMVVEYLFYSDNKVLKLKALEESYGKTNITSDVSINDIVNADELCRIQISKPRNKKYCEQCQVDCQSERQYNAHLETAKHRHLAAFIELPKYIQILNDQTKILNEIRRHNEELKLSLQKQRESYECQLDNKDKSQMRRIIEEAKLTTKCSMLEEEVKALREIAKKPVNINNNNTNYKTVNKILNVISPEAIDYSKVNTYLTAEVASNGPDAMATAVHDNLLTDSNGKPKVVCTDPSRNKFKIKDPNTGDLVDDLNLESVKLGIRDQLEFKQMKQDAYNVAQIKATKDESPELLALSYMNSIKLKGKTGKCLKDKIKQHYVGTAKVKFSDDNC